MKQSGAAWPRSPSRWLPTGTRLAHATRYIPPVPVRAPSTSSSFRKLSSRQRRCGNTTTLHGYVRGITRSRLNLGEDLSLDVTTYRFRVVKGLPHFSSRIKNASGRWSAETRQCSYISYRAIDFFFKGKGGGRGAATLSHFAPVSPSFHSRFARNDRWHGQVDINARYTHTRELTARTLRD